MDDKMHCLYVKWMTTREITATFKEMYNADVSPTLISNRLLKDIRKADETRVKELEQDLRRKEKALLDKDVYIASGSSFTGY